MVLRMEGGTERGVLAVLVGQPGGDSDRGWLVFVGVATTIVAFTWEALGT